MLRQLGLWPVIGGAQDQDMHWCLHVTKACEKLVLYKGRTE